MAVTFAVSNLVRNVTGNKRYHTGTITLTGTTTDNGDTFDAATIGLHTVDRLDFDPFLDSTANPENALEGKYIPSTPSTGVIVFFGGAAAGSPQAAVTDGATVTNYAAVFHATGT